MNAYLNVLNKLQDTFTQCGVSLKEIDLPQIAVVGCQSAGKSSVLESIAKHDLLPRGSGIVTRRPLILQMVSELQPLEKDGGKHQSWAKFLHTDKCFIKMSDVQEEIVNNTNLVCGQNKGISDEPIRLKLHSTKAPSLTLIDLPGLTKISVGDQPEDIEKQIDDLVRSYAKKDNTIILAISPGNVDIANSDSLKLAREVDPTGGRTLGVITKVDLMEETKETISILKGTSLNMKLGIVGVINRSNQMLEEGVSAETAISYEQRFFKSKFPSLAPKMGIEYLSEKLCQLLIVKLKETLPSVAEKINKELLGHKKILAGLGEEIADKKMAVINLVVKYNSDLGDLINGRKLHMDDALIEKGKKKYSSKDVAQKFRSGGSKLLQTIETKIKYLDDVLVAVNDVEKEITANTGIQPSLFIPDSVFHGLLSDKVKFLYTPVIDVIEAAKECLEQMIVETGSYTLSKYPQLETKVVMYAKDVLDSYEPKIKAFMGQYLEIQKGFINTRHPKFLERFDIAADLFWNVNNEVISYKSICNEDKIVKKTITEKEIKEKEAKLMKKLVIHYFEIIRQTVKDTLPKAIVQILVYDLLKDLKSSLLSKVLTDDADTLLIESNEDERIRKQSKKMIAMLTEATAILSNIDIHTKS